MKRIFPIITILILLSLLGIIFFQVLWIKGALESQEQKFNDHINIATSQAAEDLMQETMLAIWRKAGQFDPARGQASAWIFTIARNIWIDAWRKQKRPAFDPDDPALVPAAEPEAGDILELRQSGAALHRALKTLPQEQVDLIRLSFFDEASHSTIAAQTGLPIGTVKSRIRLAFGRLRAALEELK